MSQNRTIHLDVPSYQQYNEFSCFATCVRMVLEYYREQVDVDKLWKQGQILPHPGGWDITLAPPVIALGYHVLSNWTGTIDSWPVADETKVRYKALFTAMDNPDFEHRTDATIETIIGYLEHSVPVIVEVRVEEFYPVRQSQGWTHMVVLTGIDGDKLTYNDPHLRIGGANQEIDLEQFQVAWEELRPGCGRSLFVITKP